MVRQAWGGGFFHRLPGLLGLVELCSLALFPRLRRICRAQLARVAVTQETWRETPGGGERSRRERLRTGRVVFAFGGCMWLLCILRDVHPRHTIPGIPSDVSFSGSPGNMSRSQKELTPVYGETSSGNIFISKITHPSQNNTTVTINTRRGILPIAILFGSVRNFVQR